MILLSTITSSYIQVSYGAYAKAPLSSSGPTVNDDTLTVEKIAGGLDFPTSMAFLGPNDILVTEKTTGKVIRVTNGFVMPQPVLDVPVASAIERGLLGIAISKQPDGKTYVFLSYTESGNGVDKSDVDALVDPLGNRLYRYEFVDGAYQMTFNLIKRKSKTLQLTDEHQFFKNLFRIFVVFIPSAFSIED